MTRPRIALFGGTFDPVHWGHLLLAEAARETFQLDRVLFIPTGIPPHKSAASASVKHRLAMLRAATRSNPAFHVSDWEVRQKRVVYSHETIAHFQKTRPKLFFIVGTDSLKTLRRWKHGDRLLKACTFLAAERPGTAWHHVPAALRKNARRINWPSVPFASHAIRTRVRRKQSIRYQVPESVERYIRSRGLYR